MESKNINKDVFSWAVKRSGKTIDDIECIFPHWSEWVLNEKTPTIKQLENFSHYLHFPFGYFFLDTIPIETSTIPFFRSSQADSDNDLNVKETVNIIKDRQEWISSYLKETGVNKVSAVGICKNVDNPVYIANMIRRSLNLNEQWTLNIKTETDAISLIDKILSEIGIFLVFNGVVGNNTKRSIPVPQCRGFCLIDDYAPFIFINSQDVKCAQLFTLIHETAHVFIAYSSGFGYEDSKQDNITDTMEQLCDKTAAEVLVPYDVLCNVWNDNIKESVNLANKFKVSQAVILRRLLDCNFITKQQFICEWKNYKSTRFQIDHQHTLGGNFYHTERKRIGIRFLRYLNNAVKESKLSPLDAYDLAGVKGDTFHKLVKELC